MYAVAKRRLTREERAAQEQEALSRIVGNFSIANYAQVIAEFTARGIPADQISPKENVFTYKAWRALGRQVRKGEKGVHITTWRRSEDKTDAGGEIKPGRSFCTTAVVFHISQTDVAEGQ